MSVIPEEHLRQLKASPIFYGEINGPGQPTLNDLRRIEKNLVGSCKLPPPDLLPLYRSKLPTVYEPLILPVNNETSYSDCLWECVKKNLLPEDVGTATFSIGSALVPKPFVKVPWDKKSSYFTSFLSTIDLKDQRFKMPFKKRKFAPTMMMFKTLKPTFTMSPLRFVGRWIPALGWVLLAYDVAQISICTARCIKDNKDKLRKNKTILQS